MEEKSKLGMNLAGRNNPCRRKEQDKDAIARGKARHDLKNPRKSLGKIRKRSEEPRKRPDKAALAKTILA